MIMRLVLMSMLMCKMLALVFDLLGAPFSGVVEKLIGVIVTVV